MNSHIWRLNNLTMEYLTNDIANLPPGETVEPTWSEKLEDHFPYSPQAAAKAAELLRSKFGVRHPHVETQRDAPEAAVPPDLFPPRPAIPPPDSERLRRHQEFLIRNKLD